MFGCLAQVVPVGAPVDIFKPVGCLLAAVVTSLETCWRAQRLRSRRCCRPISILTFSYSNSSEFRPQKRREKLQQQEPLHFFNIFASSKTLAENLCSNSCSSETIKVLPDSNICCVNSEVLKWVFSPGNYAEVTLREFTVWILCSFIPLK